MDGNAQDGKTPKVFVAADLHLDHANDRGSIIEKCKRPFSSIEEMNEKLVTNWNTTIGKEDTVYFLGDLAMGKRGAEYGLTKTEYWLRKLQGKITFIKGNHDRSKTIPFLHHAIVGGKGVAFYLVHNPRSIPPDWMEWAIHAHVHNRNLELYPFINRERRRVNASIELTGYKPMLLDDIVRRILEE